MQGKPERHVGLRGGSGKAPRNVVAGGWGSTTTHQKQFPSIPRHPTIQCRIFCRGFCKKHLCEEEHGVEHCASSLCSGEAPRSAPMKPLLVVLQIQGTSKNCKNFPGGRGAPGGKTKSKHEHYCSASTSSTGSGVQAAFSSN